MKLVEILARELYVWPVDDAFPLDQAYDGELFVSCVDTPEGVPTIRTGIHTILADDIETALVTSKQWKAERDRIAKLNESEKMVHTGESVIPSVEQFTVGYEQELWDKVAISAYTMHLRTVYDNSKLQREDASDAAFHDADAFMAERAKRMKDKQ